MNTQMTNTRISAFHPLTPPREIKRQLSYGSTAAETVKKGRESLLGIMSGADQRFVIMAGPCSIHDPKQALEYGRLLATLSAQVSDRILILMRTYFEKPRTRKGWKGFIVDPDIDGEDNMDTGLFLARQLLVAIAEIGLPTVTEFLDPIVPQYIDDLVTTGTVGARTVESQIHRLMASGLSMPIGFKNSTSGNVAHAVDALIAAEGPHSFIGINDDGVVSQIETSGNPDGYIILRGGSSGTNFHEEAVGQATDAICKLGRKARIVVDCSHGNSEKDHNRQPAVLETVLRQYCAGNTSIMGVMLESNLKEGSQKIPENLKEFKKDSLNYGVSITDACMSWEITERLILDVYDRLS